MTNRNKIYSGWINSTDFALLAKPLAVLLVLIFNLSTHINASIAAGSDSLLCLSAEPTDIQDGNGNSRRAIVEHCSLCTISTQDLEANLGMVITLCVLSDNFYDTALPVAYPTENETNNNAQIRAPPIS